MEGGENLENVKKKKVKKMAISFTSSKTQKGKSNN